MYIYRYSSGIRVLSVTTSSVSFAELFYLSIIEQLQDQKYLYRALNNISGSKMLYTEENKPGL